MPLDVDGLSSQRAIYLAVVALGRALRDAGLRTSPESELALCRALAEVDVRQRSPVYWAARACFVQSPDEIAAFDVIFERFWAGQALDPGRRASEHGESDPRMTGPQHGGEALPQLRQQGRTATLVDGGISQATREVPTSGSKAEGEGHRQGALAAYSPAEAISEAAELSYAAEEVAAVRRLADDLRTALPVRRSRRLRLARRGRLDVRHTLRRSLRTEGEALRPAYVAPSLRPRRLLFLCDVSGSMDRCSRILLAALKAAVGASHRTEAFVFATRLTRLTRTLSDADVERALANARDEVADWSGGTRIGEILAGFNRTWGRRGLARGAVVIVISDGWDRGDPLELSSELQRLRLQSRRLVWINPRPAGIDDEPLAVGMRAAIPYVDDLIPSQDPRAIMGLGRLIRGLGPGRPARGRAPLHSAGGPGLASRGARKEAQR
jgi:uncharacterized protein